MCVMVCGYDGRGRRRKTRFSYVLDWDSIQDIDIARIVFKCFASFGKHKIRNWESFPTKQMIMTTEITKKQHSNDSGTGYNVIIWQDEHVYAI